MTARAWPAVLLLLPLTVAAATVAQPPAPAAADDPYWHLKAERVRAYRERDRRFFEQLLAPDFVALGADGRHRSRAEYLDAELGRDSGAAPAVDTDVARFQSQRRGDTLILRYEETEHSQVGTQRFELRLARLDVYVRIHGRWRLQAMTAVQVPDAPAALQLEPAQLDAYVGEYRFGPDIVSVVRRVGSRLLERSTGNEEAELVPIGPDLFYSPADPASRTGFERDATGRVVAQTYRIGTQLLRAQRLPTP